MAGGLWNDYYCGARYNYICGPGMFENSESFVFTTITLNILFLLLYLSLSTIFHDVASQEWCEFISEYECNDEYVKIHCPETCSGKKRVITSFTCSVISIKEIMT